MLRSIQCDAIRLYRVPETADLKNKKRKWIAGRSPSPFYVLAYTPESVLAPIQGPCSREHGMKKEDIEKNNSIIRFTFFHFAWLRLFLIASRRKNEFSRHP